MQLINPRQIHGSPEQDHDEPRMTQRTTGIALAGVTAVISGFSIFISTMQRPTRRPTTWSQRPW